MLSFEEPEYVLIDNISTGTSTGVISKAWYKNLKGKIILVKGNTNGGFEPYAEFIASKVLDILEIDHISYRLEPKEDFSEVKVYGDDVKHVSVCEEYEEIMQGQVITLWEFLDTITEVKKSDYWQAAIKFINLDQLKTLLVIDAYFANKDRHLSNIEVVFKNEKDYKLVRGFDFGASLGVTIPLKTLVDGRGLDKSKPFKDTHREQVHLICRYSNYRKRVSITRENFINTVLKFIEDEVTCIPEGRTVEMKRMLVKRMHYLDNLIDWGD